METIVAVKFVGGLKSGVDLNCPKRETSDSKRAVELRQEPHHVIRTNPSFLNESLLDDSSMAETRLHSELSFDIRVGRIILRVLVKGYPGVVALADVNLSNKQAAH